MLEGLRGECMRLQIKPGRANTEMGMSIRKQEEEVITDPVRVNKLKLIAQAFNAGQITGLQAAQLVAKV